MLKTMRLLQSSTRALIALGGAMDFAIAFAHWAVFGGNYSPAKVGVVTTP